MDDNLSFSLDLHTFILCYIYLCLTTDHEVASSIPGTSTNFKCGLGLERGPPSLLRTIGQLLIKKVEIIRRDVA